MFVFDLWLIDFMSIGSGKESIANAKLARGIHSDIGIHSGGENKKLIRNWLLW